MYFQFRIELVLDQDEVKSLFWLCMHDRYCGISNGGIVILKAYGM